MPRKVQRTVRVGVMRLAHGRGLPLPDYQSDGAAGLDLLAAVDAGAPMTIFPGARDLVPTGLALELPSGCEAQVRPRSGLALKHGVTVLNSPGTIDCDYRGEIKVLLINLGEEAFEVRRGDRIAQLVVTPVLRAELDLSDRLSRTARDTGGFGSTMPRGTAEKRNPRKARNPKRGSNRKA